MVKQNSSTNRFDRTMYDYKYRTRFGQSTALANASPPRSFHQGKPLKSNHVQVVHSKGCCCSSNKQGNVPLQPVTIQQTQVPRVTAHDRSHARFQSPDPFYSRQGRVKKTAYRTRKPYQNNQIHSTEPRNINKFYQTQQQQQQHKYYHQPSPPPPPTTTTKKNKSCCTIL